jgi:dTDP-4-dehydrorhamnose reductase/beta-phosphoglucomutase-like phosphatase (HAD superfamily)
MVVFICGASGILGKELSSLLKNNRIEYIGSYNKNYIENCVKIDFCNVNDIENEFSKLKIDVCVNCIVERQLEICEGNWNETKKSNIDITNNLSKVCKKLDIHLIHISTDYVFDGMNAPYFPNSQTNPLQNYGISKLISECKVLANTNKYTIIRVPVLYTDNITNLQDTAVTLIGKKVLNRMEISKEDNFSLRRPNYIPDFCNFIYDMIIQKNIGIYHFCNPYDKITKFEMAKIISSFLNKKLNITSIDEEPKDGAERPKDTFLKDDKYDITKYNFTPLKHGIEKCFQKLWHPKLDIQTYLNASNIFFMIDLDGTLINSDKIHYDCYRDVLKEQLNIELSYQDYYDILENRGIDIYLEETCGEDLKKIIKIKKNEKMKMIESVEFIKNADKFIEYLDKFNINHAVVTNTSMEVVNSFKDKVPLLNKIKNWVVREDYVKPKPSGECYQLAKKLYYRGEEKIIGLENSINGYLSIKNVTECVYILADTSLKNYNILKNKDVYLINDYNSIFE